MKNDIVNAWKNIDGDRVPPFAKTWRGAERRYAVTRRSYRRVAAAATVIAAVVVGANLQSPQLEMEALFEVADLLGSTSWSAPSDVLLPEHQFDIYQDMPVLIESTESAGGALL